MSEPFYRLLKPFIWPRYYEEGPPRYIDNAFFDRDFLNTDGKIKEPVKSVLDLIVLGYRPVTSLSIFSALVENQNRPMYGSQIGAQLEKRFQLPKGWFTKTRYYDTRIGRLLKILQRQNILEEMRVKDWKTKKEYMGYRIVEDIYPFVREKILSLMNGGGVSLLMQQMHSTTPKESDVVRRCSNCQASIMSRSARYCELCGAPLNANCPSCGREMSLKYQFCPSCGKRFE